MFQNLSDARKPLLPGNVVEINSELRFVVDKYIACGGFSLMYLAHKEGTSYYVALKELFPRSMDNAVAERNEQGQIVIYNPITESNEMNNLKMWDEVSSYFNREVELTNKASAVFDAKGRKEMQNNADVLHIEGPYKDTKGNLYLAIDTYQGEPMRDIIERGFLRDEDGNVQCNGYLGELLDILAKTVLRLSKLHADNRMYHLDLSPDNIYVVKTAAATEWTPHIIDYGSAYDLDNPGERSEHRYTCNPHSSPEVLALAEMNDPECGYHIDASSDTYSIASILFYAVTGKIFTPELQMFDTEWKQLIRNGYPRELHTDQGGQSFADKMIAFFEKGLSASQADRYLTADALYRALEELREMYRQCGNILSRVNPDELISYVVLDRYPLYNYKSTDGNFHVLCLGSGVFVKRMILSLVSTGQMIGAHLYIHVVSSEPEASFQSFLSTQAPELKKYSNLGNERIPDKNEYVTFSYEHVADLFDGGTINSIVSKYWDARYMVISLGSNAKNADMAYLYGNALVSRAGSDERKTVIHYYMSENAAANTRAKGRPADIPDWLQINAFGSALSSYYRAIRSLGQRALKLSYLYAKLSNPRISVQQTAKKFVDDEYGQRSSCASALHLKYKLASIGISPKTNTKTVIASYLKKLQTRSGELLELEHRRWMMYMISDGYTLSTRSDLLNYGFEFEKVDGAFNNSWKCKSRRLHHCLVPCDIYGTKLSSLSYPEWDQYRSDAEIDASGYDELDKMSLKVHLLAKEKMQRINDRGIIPELLDRISGKLTRVQEETAHENDLNTRYTKSLEAKKLFENIQSRLLAQTSAMQYVENDDLSLLECTFSEIDCNVSGEIAQLKQVLSVFSEFSSYKDYKALDLAIVDNLLWLLYSDSNLTLIKLCGKTTVDNITSPLLLEPQKLVFFGMNGSAEYTDFFRNQGNLCSITYVPFCSTKLDETYAAIKRVAVQYDGRCVLDITGANELMICAALRVAQECKNVAVIRSVSQTAQIDSVIGFDIAPAYTLQPVISADEIYTLYGAKRIPKDNQYMLKLSSHVPELWALYLKYQSIWNKITAFFANRGTLTNELYFSKVNPEKYEWTEYSRYISKRTWDSVNFQEVFQELEKKGFIKDFSKSVRSVSQYDISFKILDAGFVKAAFNAFFTRANNVFHPFTYHVDTEHGFSIIVDSGVQISYTDYDDDDFSDKKNNGCNGERIKYAEIFPVLEDFSQHGLISDLSYEFDVKKGLRTGKVEFSFIYADSSVKDCLINAGNILELYVWNEAVQTGYFDDCQSNYYFSWESGIKNELDVILTKGLSSLVVSCKTAKFNKEHLYEIASLTDQFSLNSKPVIVYSSNMAINESGKLSNDLTPVKNRARAMGVFLIDLNERNIPLGEKLVRIANGQDMP